MPTHTIANRYQPVRVLGEGAMGQVWLVEDGVSGEQVALKVISGGDAAARTEKSVLQFKQEFRLMTRLRHPNCCAVYDYGEMEDHHPYFTMEVVPGVGLDEVLPLPPERVRHVLAQLLLALGYIHQLGFVHCDIKSANVRIRPDDTVKLMDYGLMDYAGRSGEIKGTVPYVSPEMVRRAPIDQRSDLYAVGALAYEMLTGRVPFLKGSLMETLRAHVTERPEPPSRHRAGIPAELEAVVLKLLAKEPLERFQSASEALRALGVEPPKGIGGNLLTSPLQGREAPHAVLIQHLEALRGCHATGAVWIHGPAGIGKSRLLDELRCDAQLAGFPFAMGSAFATHALPYQPVVGLLRGLLPALRQHVPDALAHAAPVLVGLLPELGVAPAGEMDNEAKEKLRLHGTIGELLMALAARQPFVALLDNWQWADGLSREWLAYLLRNHAEAPFLLVLAGREAPEDTALPVQTVALGPLDAAALARMVSAMLGQEHPHEDVLACVVAVGGGVPAQVEQLLEHLVREHLLTQDEGGWRIERALEPAALAAHLPAMRERKLDTLGADARELVGAAAVLERGFDADLLRAVVGWTEERFLGALDPLRHEGILVLEADATYVFAQDAMQAAAYARLEADRRRSVHAAAAAALQGRIAAGAVEEAPLELVSAIANHLLACGPSDEAITFALVAGKRHAALLAAEEAGRLLEQGLALARGSESAGKDEWILEFLTACAVVHRRVGAADKARAALEEAIVLAERLGRRQALGRLLASLSKAYQMVDAYATALAHCERSIAIALEVGDAVGAARALLTAARIRIFLGAAADAVADAERARAIAEESGDRGSVAQAFALQGYLYVTALPEQLQTGIFNLTVAVGLFEELDDRIGLVNALTLLGDAQVMLGELAAARANIQRVRALALEVGNRLDACVALANLAITALELGNPGEALDRAREGRAIAESIQRKFHLGVQLALEGYALSLQANVDDGRACLVRARALADEIDNKYLAVHVLAYTAEAALYAGAFDDAARAADDLERLVALTGDRDPVARLEVMRAELACRRGSLDAARRHATAAHELAHERNARALEARAWQELARVALAAQRWDEAQAAIAAGLVLAVELALVGRQMQLQRLRGELALATGMAAVASEAFEGMATLAEATHQVVEHAVACFGRAAARPYAPEARDLANLAKGRLAGAVAGLAAGSQATFLALAERERVLAGNYIEFGLPAAPAQRPIRAPRPGLGPGPLL